MSDRKKIFVTGASSGVGKAICQLFLKKGWQVIATLRIPETYGEAETADLSILPLDVTDKHSIERALAIAYQRHGAIDVVVNNAGFGEFGVFEGITDDRIRANFEVNVFGVMNVIRAVLPRMRDVGRGTIVNISSGGGIIGLPATSVYLSTKFALEGFTESIWYELDGLGIGIKLVEPGGIETPFLKKIAGQAAVNIPPHDYAEFQLKIRRRMDELSWERSTALEIADVVWEASTDGKKQLRYFHGPGIQHLVHSRRTAGEPAYEKLIRAEFGFA